MQFGPEVLGYWRQSLEGDQSIYCISNITDSEQTLLLSDINLMETEQWVDLISDRQIELSTEYLSLRPYQTVWISNV